MPIYSCCNYSFKLVSVLLTETLILFFRYKRVGCHHVFMEKRSYYNVFYLQTSATGPRSLMQQLAKATRQRRCLTHLNVAVVMGPTQKRTSKLNFLFIIPIS